MVQTFPLYQCSVSAGFPSPAEEYVERTIDLNQELIRRPHATFFARVAGDSMTPNLQEGDLLVIDRSLPPVRGAVIVAALDGQMTVKRWSPGPNGGRLLPDNPSYPPISVGANSNFAVWGVVICVIRKNP